jgi:hypothetical protein
LTLKVIALLVLQEHSNQPKEYISGNQSISLKPSQQCPENYYTNKTGSWQCDKCPMNKISKKGSKSLEDCVCDKNYYKNPLNADCFPCPMGAICSSANLSTPIAKSGFWYSNQDVNAFYLCYPKEACPGGNAGNCSNFIIFLNFLKAIGYEGVRCGYCSNRYYKSVRFSQTTYFKEKSLFSMWRLFLDNR